MALDELAIVMLVYTVDNPCAVVGSTVKNPQSVVPSASSSTFIELKFPDV